MTTAPKRKSDRRWEQGRHLYQKVCPTLPTPSHVAVLMYCWFNASGKDCRFSVAQCQIAEATTLSFGRVRKIMRELTDGGVIKTLEASSGRGYAPKRMVTGRVYRPQKGGAHDPH